MLAKKSFLFIICIVVLASKNVKAQTPETYNSADIYMQLKKLNVLGSLLYIAAHPDDENNGLLPYFAKEKLYRTGYLSLTRGDGGQNLIGSEQGIELGLIRTQELLAARRIDGSEQFFSRAFEFGFSKNLTEALRIWEGEKILSDIVWVIRQYQPDVIVKRFPPDARAGHGHHAASSFLADEAFIAAADPNRFPEQFKYGVKPWQAKRIVWNTYSFGSTNTTSDDQLKFDVSGYNPLIGKSYGELGGEARSMHKSQGEGRPRRRGQSFEYFVTLKGEAPKTDLMDGIVTDWNRLPGGAVIQTSVNQIIANYNFEKPYLSVPALVKLYAALKPFPESTWKNKKMEEIQGLVEACAGLFVEATTTKEAVVQGETLNVEYFLNKRNPANISINSIKLDGFDTALNVALPDNENIRLVKPFNIADNKKISQPYWLEYPQLEGSFDVRDQMMIGKAENDPAYQATFNVTIEGENFVINRPVKYKYVDLVKGELYQPLVILPKVEVGFMANNFLSFNGKEVPVRVHFLSNEPTAPKHDLSVSVDGNWKKAPRTLSTSDRDKGDYVQTLFYIPPISTTSVKSNINAEAKVGDAIYTGSRRTIAYDHIPTITYFARANANLIKLDIALVGNKIGYIAGAGDKVPEELTAMGYNVAFIAEANLTDEYLKQFDAIVVGIRAFNIYEYLSNKQEVLNRYVKNGGNLIVQYMKANQVGLNQIKVGPYPLTVTNTRVTEENAKVTFLNPAHPVFNYPNKITEKDFEGWVQERSTYQAEGADKQYERLISMYDENDKPSNSSLVIAKYGKGNFAYVSLVLFRQLPAGVPGAYRLMANLIALPKNNAPAK